MESYSSTAAPSTAGISRFRVPTGQLVTLAVDGYDLSLPWSSTVRVRVERPYLGAQPGLVNRGLITGRVGTIDMHVQYLLRGQIVERLATTDGEFIYARSVVTDLGLIAWRGPWHEVYGWVNQPGATTRQALGLFDRLAFHDDPLGVMIAPQPIPRETLYAVSARKHLPGVGHLQVYRGADAAELVPRWRGGQVRSGEVWRKANPDTGGAPSLMLVYGSATAVSVLHAERDSDDVALRLRFLEALAALDWTDPVSS